MITIEESNSKQLSGITSLFLSFAFNQEVINVIKSCDKYAYDKKKYIWELPLTSLSYLLDNLTYLDDITLKLFAENSDKTYYYPKLTYKTKPFKHQLEGVEWLLNHEHSLLLDDPGLGKSKIIIDLANELREQRNLKHCLIICGINTLKANWKKEIKIHSDLSCRVIGEKVNSKGNIL